MPRPPRILLSQSYYHIMTRGNNRNVVFRCDEDYLYYLELVSKYKLEHHFDLYHYCLMPNHVHMLVKTNKASDFSNFMKRLNIAYFHHYRQSYGWVGHFWQDRFKSQAVGKDAYFIQCGKYIELNPVRAGLVGKPEDFIFSSYNFYLNGKKNRLITEDFMFTEMGDTTEKRQDHYQKLVVCNDIASNISKSVWGYGYQQYQEKKKHSYHMRKKHI